MILCSKYLVLTDMHGAACNLSQNFPLFWNVFCRFLLAFISLVLFSDSWSLMLFMSPLIFSELDSADQLQEVLQISPFQILVPVRREVKAEGFCRNLHVLMLQIFKVLFTILEICFLSLSFYYFHIFLDCYFASSLVLVSSSSTRRDMFAVKNQILVLNTLLSGSMLSCSPITWSIIC